MPSIVKPKVTTIKAPTAAKMTKPKAVTAPAPAPKGRAKPPKSERPMLKPAKGGWTPPKPVTTPAVNQGVPNVMARVRAIFQQLQTFNPNTWGLGGSGTFQGMETPKQGSSIQEILDNANRR